MVTSHPDSIYGNHTPPDIQHDDLCRRAGNQLDSSHALPNLSGSGSPRPSQAPPPLHQTTDGAGDNTGEDPVNTLGYITKLIQEGKVEFLTFLLSKAVAGCEPQYSHWKFAGNMVNICRLYLLYF